MTDSIPQNTPDFSKRYWLFTWDNEYTRYSGGMNDFVASCDTIEEAKHRDYLDNLGIWGMAHIFDSQDRKIILLLANKYDMWTANE